MAFEKLVKDDRSVELKDKVLLLYGFSGEQAKRLIELCAADAGLPKAHFAMVTPATRVKRVKDVIQDVVAEARGE